MLLACNLIMIFSLEKKITNYKVNSLYKNFTNSKSTNGDIVGVRVPSRAVSQKLNSCKHSKIGQADALFYFVFLESWENLDKQ